MFKCQCLCLFGFLFAVQAFIEMDSFDLVVEKIPKFPFSVDNTFDIIIGPKEEDGLLTSAPLSTILIQMSNTSGTVKDSVLIDFGYEDRFQDVYNGKLLRLKSWNISKENQLLVSLGFTSLANNQVLEIYYLNAFSVLERKEMLGNLKLAKNIYRSNITLYSQSKIEIILNSVMNSTFQFPFSWYRHISAVCRTLNNSKETPSFLKIKHVEFYDYTRHKNEAKLTFKVTKEIHQTNLTCQVGNETKSVNIQFFYAPTKVILKPEVKNEVGNGTTLSCLPADGFPIPKTKWHFITGPSNASRFYKLCPCNKTLFLFENIPIGSHWHFTCTSTNAMREGTVKTYSKRLSFRIIYKKGNYSKVNLTSESGSKNWNKSEKYDNYQIIEIKRAISNHSAKINRLNLNYLNIQNELKKWGKNEKSRKVELSKMKNNIELLKNQVKGQNVEIKKLQKKLDKDSKAPGSNKVGSNEKGSPNISSSTIRQHVAMFQWELSGIARLRRKRKTVNSHKLINRKLPFSSKLWLLLKSRYVLMVTLYMYSDREMSIPSTSGVANVTIYNAENPKLNKSMVQSFHKTYRSLSLEFPFSYDDLFEARILESDKIIIRCFFDIDSKT